MCFVSVSSPYSILRSKFISEIPSVDVKGNKPQRASELRLSPLGGYTTFNAVRTGRMW